MAVEVAPGLGAGVTGLGGPSGTRLGLPGCSGGHKEAHGDDEDEVVVAESPNFGEAICELKKTSPRKDVEETGEIQSFRISGEITGVSLSAGCLCFL